jgi:hypothetical protein
MKVKKKKIKKLRIKTEKKKAWEAFSRYCRTLWTKYGPVKCYTCDRVLTFKQVMPGHFVQGQSNRVYINGTYVRPQDFYCNIQLSGNQGTFRDRIRKELGNAEVDTLLLEAKIPLKISANEYIGLKGIYEMLLDGISE